MFKKRTIQHLQTEVLSELLSLFQAEITNLSESDLQDMAYRIAYTNQTRAIEDIFGERLVKLANLITDAKELHEDILEWQRSNIED